MDEARWQTFYQLGTSAYQSGDFEQAQQAFEVCLEEALKQQPPGLALARALNNLACALSQLGRLDQSLALQRQALELSRQLLGDQHPIVAASLLNLASDLGKQQRFAEAEACFEQALQLPSEPDVRCQALENLSQFYLAQQRLPQAAQVQEELLELRAHQPEQLARVLHSLTHLYDALGQVERADASRERTLELLDQLWGPANLASAEVVANLAESLLAQQRYLPAAELFERAYRSFALCVPADDVRLLSCSLARLLALRDGGQLPAAAQWAEQHPQDNRRWLNEWALVEFLLEHYQAAAELFQRSLELPEPLTMAVRISIEFNLASARMGQGQKQQALTLLEALVGLAEEHLGSEHSLTTRIYAQLQELYRQLDLPEQQQRMQQKLARLAL